LYTSTTQKSKPNEAQQTRQVLIESLPFFFQEEETLEPCLESAAAQALGSTTTAERSLIVAWYQVVVDLLTESEVRKYSDTLPTCLESGI